MKISQPSVTVVLGLVLSQSAFAQPPPPPPGVKVVHASAGNGCPDGYVKLATLPGCTAAMEEVGLSNFQGTETDGAWPGGCYHCDGVANCSDGVWFNKHAVGAANGGARPLCALPGWEDGVRVTLFVGDSDIDYWKTDDEYPGSANVGVAGDTCKDLNRILDDRLREYEPERVVIVCGENDLMGGQDADATFVDFQIAIETILASGARAVYLGTKPEPDTTSLHAKYEQYDAKIREYVKDLQANSPASSPPLVMVDVYPAFVAMGNPNNLYSWDELHLSDRGYAYWNTWTKTVLADESGCPHWTNNACVEEPGADAMYYVACGKGGSCRMGDGRAALAAENHAVRCCSDTATPGFKKRGQCDVWSASDVEGCHEASHAAAEGLCEVAGVDGRLCTREELADGCTQGSGCGFNRHLVWSSSPVPAGPRHRVVCGKGSGCREGDGFVAPDVSPHEVRCCSAASLPGWTKRRGCNVWTESDFDGSCYHDKSYGEAQDICTGAGGRLCTRSELEGGCSKGTGCGHDADQIWSSTEG